MARLLLVEDNLDLVKKVKEWLAWEQHVVDAVHLAEDGWQMLNTSSYDVIILDIMLPDMSGLELLKRFRLAGGVTPVIMLTGKADLDSKEKGLDAGADDYITKPFHVRELSARLRAVLRRPPQIKVGKIAVAGVELDPASHKVVYQGKDIHMQPKEFALLEFLMSHPNRVFSSRELVDRLWDADAETSEETIRTLVKMIRKKLGTTEGAEVIRTVPKLGYKIEDG